MSAQSDRPHYHICPISNKALANFFNAVEGSRIQEIKKLLRSKKVDVNYTDITDLISPLMVAAQGSSLETIKILIKHGANVNHVIRGGETPLFAAIRRNSAEIIKLLIENGANVNHKTDTGDSLIVIAVILNNLEIIKLLLDNGVNFDQQYAINGVTITPLEIALGCDKLESAKLLLEKGADVNQKNAKGNTLLMTALNERRPTMQDAIKLLVEFGSDCRIKTRDGEGVLTDECRKCILSGKATFSYEPYTEEIKAEDAKKAHAKLAAQSTPEHSSKFKLEPTEGSHAFPGGAGGLSEPKQISSKINLDAASMDRQTADPEAHTENEFHQGAHDVELDEEDDGKVVELDEDDEKVVELDEEEDGGLAEIMGSLTLPERGPKTGVVCFSAGCTDDGSSRLMKCGGCKFARYCSTECLKRDWVDHKKWCANAGEVVKEDRKARKADKKKKDAFDMDAVD